MILFILFGYKTLMQRYIKITDRKQCLVYNFKLTVVGMTTEAFAPIAKRLISMVVGIVTLFAKMKYVYRGQNFSRS